jgi:hypothetical protein
MQARIGVRVVGWSRWGLFGLSRWGFVGFEGVVWVVGRALLWGCFFWFLWVLLVSLGLLWVPLGAFSYTLCIIEWSPL